ncbi:hypothetical protein ABZ464_37000 [Streptomyces sp. NPDC005820]
MAAAALTTAALLSGTSSTAQAMPDPAQPGPFDKRVHCASTSTATTGKVA